MNRPKAMKRVRADEVGFWSAGTEATGEYLRVKLVSDKAIKDRGWPWVQACIRGILGGAEKVDKANFLSDGNLLIKTKNQQQTDKLLKATMFGEERCTICRDGRLNQSKGIIHAPDLLGLSEDEVCGWFEQFGVVAVKRFTRKDRETKRAINTPTLLLTFSKPQCPTQLEFDYVVYKVRKFVPNPLICHNCGKYGHPQDKCTVEGVCLNCSAGTHEGPCQKKCVNCQQVGHSCLDRACSVWKAEKEICEIKVDRDVSYAHARRLYDKERKTQLPTSRPYATVVRSGSEGLNRDALPRLDRVDKVETKLDRMMELLEQLIKLQTESIRAHLTPDRNGAHSPDVEPSQNAVGTVAEDEGQMVSDGSSPLILTQAEDMISDSVPDGDADLSLGEASTSDMGGDVAAGHSQGAHETERQPSVDGKPMLMKGRQGRLGDDEITPSPPIGRKPQSRKGKVQDNRRMPSLTRMAFIPEGMDQ